MAALAACGGGANAAGGNYAGGQLSDPIPLPAVTLTDTHGASYNLQQQAKGLLTVVYFGYTNCPDVCPTTMADLASAIRELPAADQRNVNVVFVTTDPQHDTPAVLRSWLDHFDTDLPRRFAGLRGSQAGVLAAAKAFGVYAESPTVDSHGQVTDAHGAQVIAFSPSDERARLIWLPDTPVSGYARDMRALLKT